MLKDYPSVVFLVSGKSSNYFCATKKPDLLWLVAMRNPERVSHSCQIIRKPGSVLSDHLSSSDVAIGLKRVE